MLVTLLLDGTPIETRCVPNVNFEIKGYCQGLQFDMIEQNEERFDFTNKKVEFILSDELIDKQITCPN